VSSFSQCCVNIQSPLIHLDASLSHLLASVPVYAGSMVVDMAGNLIALAEGSVAVSPGAILGGSCGGPAYVKLSPTGQQLFATYLPEHPRSHSMVLMRRARHTLISRPAVSRWSKINRRPRTPDA
jgi:hypothetical protein